MSDPNPFHGEALAEKIEGLRLLCEQREGHAKERIDSLKENIAQALAASDKAVAAAAQALDARVTLLNELRQVVETQGRNFATKLEVGYLRDAINELKVEGGKRTGRDTGAGQSWSVIGWAVATSAGVVVILKFAMGL